MAVEVNPMVSPGEILTSPTGLEITIERDFGSSPEPMPSQADNKRTSIKTAINLIDESFWDSMQYLLVVQTRN
jgi:hypothetical protein